MVPSIGNCAAAVRREHADFDGGVGALALLFGVSTAWVVFRYKFCGSRSLQWILLLPAAIPAAPIAYTYTDFLEYAGPVQFLLRDLFGWHSARDYWFPEIRSMGGAILVLGAVLYPYVYVMARTAFVLTPASLFEVSRMMGRGHFWHVGLPLARPAIVAGLALVLMETVSDFGTVEYFAIETLTLGIFNVWLGMNSLTAAAQIATFSFLFIIVLLAVEVLARARRRFVDTTRRSVSLAPRVVRGWRAAVCVAVCLLPVSYRLYRAGRRIAQLYHEGIFRLGRRASRGCSTEFADNRPCGGNSRYRDRCFHGACRHVRGRGGHAPADSSRFIWLRVSWHNPRYRHCDGWWRGRPNLVGIYWIFLRPDLRGWLTSGVALIVFACVIRFQAVGYGAVTTGIGRVSPSMMEASRTLGYGFSSSIRKVMLPMIRLSCVAGGLLVFVDVMKELPMNLLLRPLISKHSQPLSISLRKMNCSRRRRLPALGIVLCGIIPVVLMNAALNKLRIKMSKQREGR